MNRAAVFRLQAKGKGPSSLWSAKGVSIPAWDEGVATMREGGREGCIALPV